MADENAAVLTQDVAEPKDNAEVSTPAKAEVTAGEEQDPQAKPEQGDNETPEQKEKKRLGGWQRKIVKTEAERDFWREEALRARTAEKPADKTEAKPAEEPEPDPNSFETVAEYLKAVRAFDRKQLERELDARLEAKDKAAKQKSEQQTLEQKWQERETAFEKEHSDYAEVFAEAQAVIQRHANDSLKSVASAIAESDLGPQLVYHLGQNPDEVERLAKLSPNRALAELGKLEAVIANPKPAAQDDELQRDSTTGRFVGTTVAPVSKAPAPPTPVKKTSSAVAPDIHDPKMPYKDWVKLRESQIEKRR